MSVCVRSRPHGPSPSHYSPIGPIGLLSFPSTGPQRPPCGAAPTSLSWPTAAPPLGSQSRPLIGLPHSSPPVGNPSGGQPWPNGPCEPPCLTRSATQGAGGGHVAAQAEFGVPVLKNTRVLVYSTHLCVPASRGSLSKRFKPQASPPAGSFQPQACFPCPLCNAPAGRSNLKHVFSAGCPLFQSKTRPLAHFPNVSNLKQGPFPTSSMYPGGFPISRRAFPTSSMLSIRVFQVLQSQTHYPAPFQSVSSLKQGRFQPQAYLSGRFPIPRREFPTSSMFSLLVF